MTIYDSLALVNKSFGFYINSSLPHACNDYPRTCDHSSWNMMGDTAGSFKQTNKQNRLFHVMALN